MGCDDAIPIFIYYLQYLDIDEDREMRPNDDLDDSWCNVTVSKLLDDIKDFDYHDHMTVSRGNIAPTYRIIDVIAKEGKCIIMCGAEYKSWDEVFEEDYDDDYDDDDTAQASPRLQPWVELGAKIIA